ncbi:flagellar filament capping protein FliD [Noviherbaspirillum sp. ST9]|uniref:flagellar filament capping protein FliD n=1 Tax=Noviherbaspirillum sp. ST9 TaxID=3401606 RepID=UPI003B58A6AA
MAISSAGVGSNLDINSIITQLMSVEQQPLVALAKKEASFQAKLTAVGTLKGALSSFQSATRALADPAKFQSMRTTAADATIVSASGSATAVPGTYSLEVTKLAQAQKLATAGQANSNTAIGNGTLTFDFGTIGNVPPGTFNSTTGQYTGASFTSSGSGTKTVTIDATNNSLSGIRDAINKAKIGVTATIVNDGGTSPYRLVLTENSTGKASSMKISVTGDAALSSLLAHDPSNDTGQALKETMAAQNAEFTVDGIAVSKSTNSVNDVIPGVTLNLLKTNSGSATTVTVATDTSAVMGNVGLFVKAYNDVTQTLKDLSAYNATTKQAAVLNGDASVRNIQAQIRNLLNTTISGGAGAFTDLSQIGVTIQKDGKMAVDNTKLQAAMDSSFKDVAAMFSAVGKASDSLVSYSGSTSSTKSGAYALNITQLATKGTSVGGAAIGSLTIDATNDALDVKLDGVTASISLTQKTYASNAELAAEIQSKINGVANFVASGSVVSVTESAGVLTLTSSRYGSASNISITGGTGKDNVVGATPTNTPGVDVAGTINGSAGAGSGQILTGATGNDAEGLKIVISGGALGARGTINYSQGYAYQFAGLTDQILGTTGAITSRTEGINSSLKSIAQQKERIGVQLAAVEKRYRAQFTALDTAISSMNKTSAFLTQQLGILNKQAAG